MGCARIPLALCGTALHVMLSPVRTYKNVRLQEGPQAQNTAIQKDVSYVFLDRRVLSLRPLLEPHVLRGCQHSASTADGCACMQVEL